MIIGTAGHIDHGKTALVKALTGVDADRLAEEKKRGITIDLGYAYFPLPDGTIGGFVDVPGHERFVHNMLAGATGIDLVMLVIAADDGVMPQTVEHLQIVDLLGIETGIVALTKADLADGELRARRIAEIQALLAPTKLAGAPILPVSSLTGEGIEGLRDLLAMHSGERRPASGYPRLAIDRVFTLQGAGLVVTGTLFSGEIRVGDRLTVSPKGFEARVRSLHAQNQPAERAVAGDRCALNIAGPRVSKEDIARGDWVLSPELHAPTSVIDVRLDYLAGEQKPLKHWTPVHVHLAAAHGMGRVALLEGDTLAPGESALAQIVLDQPIGALAHDRLILRDASAQATIGGGVVIDPFASTRHRRRPDRLERLQALDNATAEAVRLLLAAPPGFFERAAFALAQNLRPEEAAALFERLGAVIAGGIVFGRDHWIAAREALIATLASHHEKSPNHPGLQAERLRNMMPVKLTKDAFAEVLGAERKIGGVVDDGPWLRLPSHKVSLSAEEERLWRHIHAVIQANRFKPPRVRDFAVELDVEEEDMRNLMRRLVRLGRVIEVAHDHFFLREAVAEMIQIAFDIAAANPHGEVTAAAFRDRIDSGRKVAIQILEFLDRQGVTIRRGDRRRVRADRLSYFGAVA
ncbi:MULTISPECIES: selenocysteine-specific translation elongation factor [Rhodomicrobium]|uniref:selenocysteine-specific translation elongation factor n=1 Tax=Rhodomicrobium TaxID=1068 RepID=UPI000B4AE6B8|nr:MULTISPECIES: selenocysteine-specific translation elongation factor [Rhodomicrobium]